MKTGELIKMALFKYGEVLCNTEVLMTCETRSVSKVLQNLVKLQIASSLWLFSWSFI